MVKTTDILQPVCLTILLPQLQDTTSTTTPNTAIFTNNFINLLEINFFDYICKNHFRTVIKHRLKLNKYRIFLNMSKELILHLSSQSGKYFEIATRIV